MASGSFGITRTSGSKYCSFFVNWSYTSNTSGNYSDVIVSVYIKKSSSSTSNTWGTSNTSATVNGSTQYENGLSFSVSPGSQTLLFSKSYRVYHNSDGSKQTTISVSVGGDIVGASGSATITLDRIPRASSFTVSGNQLGSQLTFNITRADSSFTHNVFYYFGNKNVQIANGVATSCTYTPSLEDAQFIPNNTSGTGTITVDTYSDGTKIGSSSKSIVLYLPEDVIPTIDDILFEDEDSSITEKFDCFVQNKSKLKATINASGIYSSTIKNYNSNINNSNYVDNPFTTEYLTIAGTNELTFSVTDSRNRIATVTKEIEVINYEVPLINEFTVVRDEIVQSNVNITINAIISDINSKNDKGFILKYKKSSEENYTSKVLNNSSYTINTIITLTDISENDTYNFVLEVTDYFTTISRNLNISTAFTLMNYNSSGKGIGIGKVSEKDALEVDLDFYYKGTEITELLKPNQTIYVKEDDGFNIEIKEIQNDKLPIIVCGADNSKTIFVAIIFATSTDTEPIFTILSGDKTITKKNNKYHINSDASSVYMISCPYGTNIELIEGTL